MGRRKGSGGDRKERLEGRRSEGRNRKRRKDKWRKRTSGTVASKKFKRLEQAIGFVVRLHLAA